MRPAVKMLHYHSVVAVADACHCPLLDYEIAVGPGAWLHSEIVKPVDQVVTAAEGSVNERQVTADDCRSGYKGRTMMSSSVDVLVSRGIGIVGR